MKGLANAKSRLSKVVPEHLRRRLVLAMLQDVTCALQTCGLLSAIVVVSPDESVGENCRRQGVDFVLDRGNGLNEAIVQASEEICSGGCPEALIVFPVDIPLLKPRTVTDVISLLDIDASALVVAAESRDGGTNMLMRRPPRVISTSFGPSSFSVHKQMAEQAGIRFEAYHSPDLQFDVDTEEDLLELLECGGETSAAKLAPYLLSAIGKTRAGCATRNITRVVGPC